MRANIPRAHREWTADSLPGTHPDLLGHLGQDDRSIPRALALARDALRRLVGLPNPLLLPCHSWHVFQDVTHFLYRSSPELLHAVAAPSEFVCDFREGKPFEFSRKGTDVDQPRNLAKSVTVE